MSCNNCNKMSQSDYNSLSNRATKKTKKIHIVVRLKNCDCYEIFEKDKYNKNSTPGTVVYESELL